ncbi:MAG: hypothetical protein RBT39_01640 [Azoarcus sp.]|jgi:hypothetical protein|nr:hypothetical protein [Azoarcus sp.]MDX9836249.1 hypothetical protein [Azoarcus sp.]
MVIYMDMQTGKEIREAGRSDEEVLATTRRPLPETALQMQEINFSERARPMPLPRDIETFLNAMRSQEA